jgi:hypothetical protein
MKFADILLLLKRNQSPTDWMRVDDEEGDGGNTSFCLEDVLLRISFSVVWRNSKPLMRFRILYGSTVLSWFELPLASIDNLPNDAEILAAIKKRISDLDRMSNFN